MFVHDYLYACRELTGSVSCDFTYADPYRDTASVESERAAARRAEF
jgi:hypothetical protein